MPGTRRREERFNSKLADAFSRRGASAEAEVIASHGGSTKLPDIQLRWAGLPVVVECKFDAPGARDEVEQQAQERLTQAFGSVAMALIYPPELRNVDDVDAGLESATFHVKLFAPGQSTRIWTPVRGVEGLAATLDRARTQLANDDVVAATAALMQGGVDAFARAAMYQPGRVDDLLAIVTVEDVAGAGQGDDEAKAAAVKICGLAVTTAAILQAELSRFDSAVPQPPVVAPDDLRTALIASWKRILDHDYAAVFAIAVRVLEQLSDGDPALGMALKSITDAAQEVTRRQVIGRHDLVGRIYHTLLADKKFLATYYTSVPAATLLCQLALEPSGWPDVDWAAEPDEFALRVGDLACGTGTLLAASVAEIRHRWVSARASAGLPVEPTGLGRRLIEDNVLGLDVLAYAVQVCAATLLLSCPGSVVTRTRLYQMPFGGAEGRLGTLELLIGETQAALFGDQAHRQIGLDAPQAATVSLQEPPELHLVVMNPPFTRSVGGSQLLGSLRGAEHDAARRALASLIRRPDVAGDLNAGLGAPFVELAHRCVRSGGRLALVLPKTVLTGESWSATRTLLAESWQIEHVITSHEPGRWNFSDSTELSEALIVARKHRLDESEAERLSATTRWTALWRNAESPVDALAIADALRRAPIEAAGAPVQIGEGLDSIIGETFLRPAPTTGAPWRHATFARAALDAAAEAMIGRQPIPLPRATDPVDVPLVPLHELGEIGPDRARIHDAFTRSPRQTGYSVYWGHDSDTIRSPAQAPNGYLNAKAGREDYAARLWEASGRLLVAERMRLNTQRCAAVTLTDPALSNMWWPVSLASDDPDDEKILALWVNSTLGLLSFIAISEETQGPFVAVKKNKLRDLPVIAPGALGSETRATLLAEWEGLAASQLEPVSRLDHDPARARIDAAFVTALGIEGPPLDALRRLLESEPRFGQPRPREPATPPPDDSQQLLFPI